MTISKDTVYLWDDGERSLCALAVPQDQQYRYMDEDPCITLGFAYEDAFFKGRDEFTFFDKGYVDLVAALENMYRTLDGSVRLYDMGGETDGYIEIAVRRGKVSLRGQLGASFLDFSLKFQLEADQTLLHTLLHCLKMGL